MQANSQVTRLRTMLDMTMRRVGLGQRISEARRAKGWKQKHLAAEVSVEPMTISRYERGVTTPDLNMIERIADALDQPLDYFITPRSISPEGVEKVLAVLAGFEVRLGRIEAALNVSPDPGSVPRSRRSSAKLR